MYSFRKWMLRPKKTDNSQLAQFFHADEELNVVAAELDSFDGRRDPERCTSLVNKLRSCQDKLLTIVEGIMKNVIPDKRASRDFRVKFPDDVLQEGLAGQLWFGAECLAAGSSIMNREVESASMRPTAKVLVRHLDFLRSLLRDQALRNTPDFSQELINALVEFDQRFADFELSYVSAMVPVKTMKEYDMLQDVMVLFCESVERALRLGLLTTDMLEAYEPALMFTIPRLAIVTGLIVYPEGPLNPDQDPNRMSEMFRPFHTLLYKIRELLWTLSLEEMKLLEVSLCSTEEPNIPRPLAEDNEDMLNVNAQDAAVARFLDEDDLTMMSHSTSNVTVTADPGSSPTNSSLNAELTPSPSDSSQLLNSAVGASAVGGSGSKPKQHEDATDATGVGEPETAGAMAATSSLHQLEQAGPSVHELEAVGPDLAQLDALAAALDQFEALGPLEDDGDLDALARRLRHSRSWPEGERTNRNVARTVRHRAGSREFDFHLPQSSHRTIQEERNHGDDGIYFTENSENGSSVSFVTDTLNQLLKTDTQSLKDDSTNAIIANVQEISDTSDTDETDTSSEYAHGESNNSDIDSEDIVDKSAMDKSADVLTRGDNVVDKCDNKTQNSDSNFDPELVQSVQKLDQTAPKTEENVPQSNATVPNAAVPPNCDNADLSPNIHSTHAAVTESVTVRDETTLDSVISAPVTNPQIVSASDLNSGNVFVPESDAVSGNDPVSDPVFQSCDSTGQCSPQSLPYSNDQSSTDPQVITSPATNNANQASNNAGSEATNFGSGAKNVSELTQNVSCDDVKSKHTSGKDVNKNCVSSQKMKSDKVKGRSTGRKKRDKAKIEESNRRKREAVAGSQRRQRDRRFDRSLEAGLARQLSAPPVTAAGAYSLDFDKDSYSSSSETSSYNSDCADDEEIALAIAAAEAAARREARARFKTSHDLIHRLFVCISGVADQLQTNYAADLRHILKVVFEVTTTPADYYDGEMPPVPEAPTAPLVSSPPHDNSDSDATSSSDSDDYNESPEVLNAEPVGERSTGGTADEPEIEGAAAAEEPPEWVPDEEAPFCTACKIPFNFVRRRHHCRNCGKIFCGRCSSNSVPLPHFGHVKPVRVCNHCYMFQVTPFMVE